jgi:hypothetical protein
MEEKNCLDCLYANYDEHAILFGKYLDGEHRRCEHPNSPYFDQIVSSRNMCRLFVDEKEYFRNKDLREKVIKLKNKKK